MLYVFKFVLIITCASVFAGVCFMFAYILSRNFIDLIIPLVIHWDFLCLCLLYFTRFEGMHLSAASDIILSSMS